MRMVRRRRKKAKTTKRRARKNPSSALRKHNALRKRAARLGVSTKGTTAVLQARVARAGGGRKKAKTTRRKTTRKATRRKNPARKRRTARKVTRRRRRNPTTALRHHNALRKEAARLGVSAKGTSGQLEARIAGAKGLTKKVARRRRTGRAAGRRKSAMVRRVRGKHTRSARTVIRRAKKRSPRRAVARSYMRVRSINSRIKRNRFPKGAAQLARSYGLTKVNPSLKAIVKDLKPMVVPGAVAGGVALGMAAGGHKLGAILMKNDMVQKLPTWLQRGLMPGAAAAITAVAWYGVKRSAKLQKFSAPVFFGGAAGVALLAAIYTQTGQKIMHKLGFGVAIPDPSTTPEGLKEAAAGEPVSGLGDYITVENWLGQYTDMVLPQTDAQYGRRQLGEYLYSDYPVHEPGPGDPMSVYASLETVNGFGDYIDTDNPAAPYEPAGYLMGAYETVQTPGGTQLEPLGEFGEGIFNGSSI